MGQWLSERLGQPFVVENRPGAGAVGEAVPGYESSGWVGIGVPKNTPVAIVEKLNAEINAGLVDPRIRARLAELGGNPLVGLPADFGALVAEETHRWAKVIRSAGIKPD
ncbi:tripartite tricarboxylate transporter substrate-binding protein [Reyranella soli]|nr:tripartite tricarboxylate transporter substrate-binding protein [Reyranella soli]